MEDMQGSHHASLHVYPGGQFNLAGASPFPCTKLARTRGAARAVAEWLYTTIYCHEIRSELTGSSPTIMGPGEFNNDILRKRGEPVDELKTMHHRSPVRPADRLGVLSSE